MVVNGRLAFADVLLQDRLVHKCVQALWTNLYFSYNNSSICFVRADKCDGLFAFNVATVPSLPIRI